MTDSVRQRKLPKADVELTELGFGAASMGNLYAPVPEAVARATLNSALEAGFRYFDTAPYYGFGLSERRVGDALRDMTGVSISTKVGRLLEPCRHVNGGEERNGFCSSMPFRPVFDYRHDAILRSFEDSLQRLGLARVDILYVHDIGRATHPTAAVTYMEQLTTGGGFGALEKLRSEGAIKAFGIGVNEVEVCLEILDQVDLDVILLAGRYTLLEQEALKELFPLCERVGTAIVVGGPYNSGILAKGTRDGSPLYYNYEPAPTHIVERVRRIEQVCERHGIPLKAAALQFPLGHRIVASVIPGMATPAEVKETAQLYRLPIPPAFWEELRYEGLLLGGAPVLAGATH